MKKVFSAVLALMLCFTLGGTALADGEPYETAGELYQSWYQAEGGANPYPYPDYVAGVWTPDGSGVTLTFALVEGAGDAEKEAILSQVRDKSTVRFVEGFRCSIAELYTIQKALTPYLGDKTGAFGVGIDQQKNIVHISIDMSNPGAEAFMRDCLAKYGNTVAFQDGNGINVNTEALNPVPQTAAQASPSALYWLLAAAAFAALALVLLRRRSAVAQTPEGVTLNVARPSEHQIEAAIQAKAQTPPEALHRAIQDKIGFPRA